ncbi:hypothetical protein AVEN_63190-1 [Araneus ventricosus]|uniref:Uncharacterized protein n=1 Tax=Araneus ventricosus TaxID=182803 RepID=A0A4Y2B1A4_ARAVE|nr:hypothetical protein AVEN_63190-1 [Araneus ventricosus]
MMLIKHGTAAHSLNMMTLAEAEYPLPASKANIRSRLLHRLTLAELELWLAQCTLLKKMAITMPRRKKRKKEAINDLEFDAKCYSLWGFYSARCCVAWNYGGNRVDNTCIHL